MTKATKKEIKTIAKKTAKKVAEKALSTPPKTKKARTKTKTISTRVETVKIKGLGFMPVTIYTTSIGDESFSHTDKKAVKEWRKDNKAVKNLDPATIVTRLEKAVKRAAKHLGDDLAADTCNHALTG